MHGRMMYEVRPDLFPHGRITPTERELWARHYDEQNRRWEERKEVRKK